MVVHHICAPQCVKFMIIVSQICVVFAYFELFCEFSMDSSQENGKDDTVHCLGCKAGLTESCSHVASVMIYIECWARVNGKMACTQVKCAWLLPTYVTEISYSRVKVIDFSSAKKLKENLDTLIDSQDTTCADDSQVETTSSKATTVIPSHPASKSEINIFYEALNQCETKASVLSLLDPYAEQFEAKSRNVPVLSDLFEPTNLDLEYPELIQKCKNVKINMSDEEI